MPAKLDPDLNSKHQGETREQRLAEFHEENDTTVVGLREDSVLSIKDDNILLLGAHSARIFRKDMDPIEMQPGENLKDALNLLEKINTYTPTLFKAKENVITTTSSTSISEYKFNSPNII